MPSKLLLAATVALISCTFLEPKAPTAKESLESLQTACVVAEATDNLPQEAEEACKLLKSLRVEDPK